MKAIHALLCTASLLAIGCGELRQLRTVLALESELPPPPERVSVALLDQGPDWTEERRAWFHHTSQGTSIMPLSWFLALRQPRLFTTERLSDPVYLSRFGFLESGDQYNASGLPIGFAVIDPFDAPGVENGEPQVGFTCAACHTGEVRAAGKAWRIEGGPAMTDLGKFRIAVGGSLALTARLPWRFSAFADEVLGEGRTREQTKALEDAVDEWFAVRADRVAHAQSFASRGADQDQSKPYDVEEGFGRLDALERISDTVFGSQLDGANYRAVDAPVAYPHIWHTHWFDWVQYNASIRQPMARNVGEALGVNAPVRLRGEPRWASSVLVDNLYQLEKLLAGPSPWEGGLDAPAWPAELGRIDVARAQTGRQLYLELCEKCHLDPDTWRQPDHPRWTGGQEETTNLRLTVIPVVDIGTDPLQAVNFAERSVDTGPLGLGVLPVAQVLEVATQNVADHWYDARGTSPETRREMNGNRRNLVRSTVAGKPVYKARPLDGIWATPPYLHNGSVPNLYELLSENRSVTFCLGSRDFDPVKVGYASSLDGEKCPTGTFLLDTRTRGNSNAGHLLTDDTARPGRLQHGRALNDDEKYALIEYLKTIPNPARRVARP